MPNVQPWYWNPDRLKRLCRLLENAAQEDKDGHYIGPFALNAYVLSNGEQVELADLTVGRVKVGLAMLRYLGVLETGKTGPKTPNQKRRLYLEKASSITDDVVRRFRQEMAAKSPGLPSR